MSTPQKISGTQELWFDDLPERLRTAVDHYNLPETSDWSNLAELSSSTRFNEIDVYGEASILDEGRIFAPATVFVDLVYEPGNGEVVASEAFPARVYYRVINSDIEIDHIEVDTSSFYE